MAVMDRVVMTTRDDVASLIHGLSFCSMLAAIRCLSNAVIGQNRA
jgi:hypothetical protein